jgi:hypothetical protein
VDWKRFYRDELASPAGRSAVRDALTRHADGDAHVKSVLASGGIVSFPHTTLRDSADPIARVVQSILALGAPRVMALGVLHGGTLPEPWRTDLAEFRRDGPCAEDAFRRLRGAFVGEGGPTAAELLRANDDVLAHEFSLDLFRALLADAANQSGAGVPHVTSVFVSLTRDRSGSFTTAAALADAIRPLLTADTVCVATGDLVHYGHSYTPDAEMAGMRTETPALEAYFRPRVDAMLAAGLRCHDDDAFAAGTSLRSDQRHLLPVIARIVGPGATAEVLSFRLTDYARINGVDAPCLVASALVAFRRAP